MNGLRAAPITVFRVENPVTRQGPYVTPWPGCEAMRDHHNDLCDVTHPGGASILPDYWSVPSLDYTRYYYGCPDMASLREWFEGYWDALMEAGFVVRKYVTRHYYMAPFGIPQVAFIPERSSNDAG